MGDAINIAKDVTAAFTVFRVVDSEGTHLYRIGIGSESMWLTLEQFADLGEIVQRERKGNLGIWP